MTVLAEIESSDSPLAYLANRGRRIPLVVPMLRDDGFARLLPDADNDHGTFGNITTIGLYSQHLTVDLFESDMFAVTGRAIHEWYRAHRVMVGDVDPDDPAMTAFFTNPAGHLSLCAYS